MTARLNIRIDRGGMPRSGILNKQFDLFLDDTALAYLGWGETRSFNIPAGKHTLTLKYRRFDVYYRLPIMAVEGQTVEIDSIMDTKKGGFTLFNRADGLSSNSPGSGSTPHEELVKKGQAFGDEMTIGVCASACAILFVVLNILTGGQVPGGFLGGAIGGGLGALAGMGINALRKNSTGR